MPRSNEEYLAPLATQAVAWQISRERLLRAICTGRVRGEHRFGRRLVDVRDAENAKVVRALSDQSRQPGTS